VGHEGDGGRHFSANEMAATYQHRRGRTLWKRVGPGLSRACLALKPLAIARACEGGHFPSLLTSPNADALLRRRMHLLCATESRKVEKPHPPLKWRMLCSLQQLAMGDGFKDRVSVPQCETTQSTPSSSLSSQSLMDNLKDLYQQRQGSKNMTARANAGPTAQLAGDRRAPSATER
jgi:hypothetical protein